MAGCRPFEEAEIVAMLRILKGRDSLLLALGCMTGFRISELLSVRVSDVVDYNQEPPTVKDYLTVQRRHMKRKTQSRTVRLPDLAHLLQPWLDHMAAWGFRKRSDFLFIQSNGQPIDRITAYRIIKKAANTLGLPGTIGTHSMRKTYAKRAFERYAIKDQARAILKTREALGHKSITSTESYLESVIGETDPTIEEIQNEMMHIFSKPTQTQQPDERRLSQITGAK